MLKTFPPPSSLRNNQLVNLFIMIWMNLANLCRYVYVHQNVETFTIVQILYTIFVRGMLLCFRDIVLSLHQSKYAYGYAFPPPYLGIIPKKNTFVTASLSQAENLTPSPPLSRCSLVHSSCEPFGTFGTHFAHHFRAF